VSGGGERYTGTSQNFIQPENGFLTQFNGKEICKTTRSVLAFPRGELGGIFVNGSIAIRKAD